MSAFCKKYSHLCLSWPGVPEGAALVCEGLYNELDQVEVGEKFQAVHGTTSPRAEQRTFGVLYLINYLSSTALHLIQTQLDISEPFWTIDYTLICDASCPIYITFTRLEESHHIFFLHMLLMPNINASWMSPVALTAILISTYQRIRSRPFFICTSVIDNCVHIFFCHTANQFLIQE